MSVTVQWTFLQVCFPKWVGMDLCMNITPCLHRTSFKKQNKKKWK